MLVMENAEEVLQILERFAKLKLKDIPKELESYLCYVAETGDTVFRWPMIKYLFREKLLQVIKEFYENTPSIADLPQDPNVDPFNYETMKSGLIERLEIFHAAPFTVQRLCELLTDPRKQYSRIDKFMRAIEKNILVVSTVEPGRRTEPMDSITNGDLSSESIDSDENMPFGDQIPTLKLNSSFEMPEKTAKDGKDKKVAYVETKFDNDKKKEEADEEEEVKDKPVEDIKSETVETEKPTVVEKEVEKPKLDAVEPPEKKTESEPQSSSEDSSDAPSSTVISSATSDESSDSSSDPETKQESMSSTEDEPTAITTTIAATDAHSSENEIVIPIENVVSPRSTLKRSCEEMTDEEDNSGDVQSESIDRTQPQPIKRLRDEAEIKVDKEKESMEDEKPSSTTDEISKSETDSTSDLYMYDIELPAAVVNILEEVTEEVDKLEEAASISSQEPEVVDKMVEEDVPQSTVFDNIPEEEEPAKVVKPSEESSPPPPQEPIVVKESSIVEPTTTEVPTPTAQAKISSETPIEYTEASISDLPVPPLSPEKPIESAPELVVPIEAATSQPTVDVPTSVEIQPIVAPIISETVPSIALVPEVAVVEPLLEMDTTQSDESKMDDEDETAPPIVGDIIPTDSVDSAMDVDDAVEPMDQ